MIGSYSSPFAVGHKVLEDFWEGAVWVEEKVDGSQFSFRREGSTLLARAHKQDLTMFTGEPEHAGMFRLALETALRLLPDLHEGWSYRGEFLAKPKQNTLAYERVPVGNVILFDVDRGLEDYATPFEAAAEARRLGLEFVPLLGQFTTRPTLDELTAYLERDALLGGTKIEGVVLKNYARFGPDKKVLMAKLVRRDFVEENKAMWKAAKASPVDTLIKRYATEARWLKAVQHLQEQGKLATTPQDIGLLVHEIPEDVRKDAEDEIRDALWAAFWPDIRRGLTRGLPEWYKRKIVTDVVTDGAFE